ncbi:MAG TPA: glutathione S-transferase C-terminal domain-containing protein [Streptosporangiaceae bacterium]|nr:glutathione S-transferase C-terminal domain-containing protein [Streptosporangiaceae bacterium]
MLSPHPGVELVPYGQPTGSTTLNGLITRDGSTGYAAEPGRYQLYASLACPWSHRAVIVRKLLGLERVIGLSLTDPIRDENGWRFPASTGGVDYVTGARYVSELYLATDPGYAGRFTIPCLWDTRTQRIVTNDVPQITVTLETEFRGYHRPGAPDLYPEELRPDIDALSTLIFHAVNNGVYTAGLATSQAAYEDAFDTLFATLAALEERLSNRRYLVGGQLTEADVRLFPTLVRFDAVYHTHFKCNLRRLIDYPSLWAYARDLYQQPGFGDTTDFGQIKRHYYQTQDWINPSRIVPKGPYVDWLSPHDRTRFSGRS